MPPITQLVGKLELEPRSKVPAPSKMLCCLPHRLEKKKGTFTPLNITICDVKNAVPRSGPYPRSNTLRILFLDQAFPKGFNFSSEHHSLRARGSMRADIMFYAELIK